jgi:hypothetical protein
MKKIYYFAMAVLGAVTMVSCVKDIEDNNNPLAHIGENSVTFSISSSATTRAGNEDVAVTRGVTIPLGKVEDGPALCLEETVTDLDAVAPITRGTPAYTENAGVLYANKLTVYSPDGSFGEATFENMDDSQIEGGGWRYFHTYAADPWPDGTAKFYLRMPETMTGVTFGEDAYTTAGAITFTYTSPATAAAQQDILFAYTTMDKATYKANHSTNGMPVLFNHALTGVKFAIGNDEDDITNNKIAIKGISIIGLKDNGTCTITPRATGTHVSAAAARWDANTLTTTLDSLYSGAYNSAPITYGSEEGQVADFGENGTYPDSFASAGNEDNLGSADGSQTFWLIPQAIDANVKLGIKYTFAEKEYYGILDFGAALAAASTSTIEWKAGQLRTYTIRVDEVNVKIADTVVPTATPNTTLISLITGEPILDEHGDEIKFIAYGGTKSAVTITNTGNTDSFIRAALIGQWLDKDGNPVFGFTDYTAGKVVLVDSWYQDQFVSHKGLHGWFVDLPGYRNDNKGIDNDEEVNNWILIDGYYYYKNKVSAGQAVPDDLFTSYTVGLNPAVVVAGEVKDVYFTLEIATQAVTAKNPTGGDYSLSEAWSKAGVTVTVPTSD